MKKLFSILILVALSFLVNAQEVHINREWRDYTGNPVFNPILNPFGLEWTKSIPSATAGLITVGHTQVSGQGENILLTKYDDGGSILWQVNYNAGGTRNDYGIDLKEDASSGFIYVVGTTDNGGTTNHDVIVLVYNSSGTLQYSTSYDVNGLNDIGTAINFDSSGYPVVCASSESSSTMSDFLVLSYDNTLSLLWNTVYDYNSLIDVPVGIEVIGGKVVVAGASANSLTDWDYAVVEFDETTGSYLADTRDNISGVGYDQPFAFCKDASGNTYVTGRASTNGINYDVRTMKISPLNTIVWTQTFDGFGLEDVGNTIAIDGSGNVIVGGFITKSNNKKDLVVLKYNSSGTLQWAQTQTSKDPTADAFVKKIVLNTSGDIYYIAGEKGIGANKQALVGKIKSSGKKNWERSIKGNYDYLPSDIQFGGGGGTGVYTIAIKDSTINVYETAYYTEMERDTARAFENNSPLYKKHEFIINFNASAIDTTKINNKDITHGYLSEFLTVTSFTALGDYLRTDLSDVKAFKIFPKLTSHNMHSTSRTGVTVNLPPLYATLGVILPSSFNDTLVETKLQKSPVGLLQTANLNYYVHLCSTNDVDYVNGNSAGLDATSTFSLSSINATPAWSIEVGNPNIKAGVFDTGINPTHTDFNLNNVSKIIDGYDYFNDFPMPSVNPNQVDLLGHGSGIAGIIAGIRNNNFGVAGIAGGDASVNNPGVSLYDMKCFEGNDNGGAASAFSAGLDKIENAMIDGALSSATASIGQGLHLQNHSWSISSNFTIQFADLMDLKAKMNVVFENECLMSFSSGNYENAAFTTSVTNVVANLKDEYNLCVGGVDGTGGRWTSVSNGASQGGKFLDFLAPAHPDLYNLVAKNTNTTTDYMVWNSSTPSPSTNLAFGTSFANPHAVGVAALMMSYINNHPQKPNNIAPEDIEQMMEKSATDMTVSPYSVGYDPQTGAGRINAANALNNIVLPEFNLKHFNTTTTLGACTVVQVATLQSIWFPQAWNGFGPGYGLVNKYEVTYTNSHSIGAYSVIDAWKRDAQCNLPGSLVSPTATIPPPESYIPNHTDSYLDSYTSSAANLRGYIYENMMWNGSTYVPSGHWFPMDLTSTNQIKWAYTIRCYDAFAGIKETQKKHSEIYVYPNPANDKLLISADGNQPKKIEVRIVDVMGKLLYQDNIIINGSSDEKEIITSNLINGIYFVSLKEENGKTVTFKQIISH